MTAVAQADTRRAKKARPEARGGRRGADTSYLAADLDSMELGGKPTIHVNGHNYSMALVTVDFGSPLKPTKMNQDQNQEFSDRLRKLAREVLGREVNIRISHDGPNGIYVASVA